MRILVMGSGGLGGYFGGILARHGHDVTFVARGAHLAAMRERGLEVRTESETFRLSPVSAVGAPGEAAGAFDLILFTVKGYDAEAAATALRPAIGPETAVLTVLNGVDSAEQLADILGPEHVLAGTTFIRSTLAEPGVIEQMGTLRRVVFGEFVGGVTPRVEAIAKALRDVGVDTEIARDSRVAVWEKFVMQAPHATMTSVCQMPCGPIRETPEGEALYRALIDEAIAVGRASGVALPEDAAETAMAVVWRFLYEQKTSMSIDYERGNRVELDQLTGAVARRGKALGVPTPTFDILYGVLKVRALASGGLA
jgi:2-dehydropantoate 2-reductase